jgi:hypothetical protein
VDGTVKVSLEVTLDEIDQAIIGIFKNSPSKYFSAYQIRTLLEYQDIGIGYGTLAFKLHVLSILSLIAVEKTSRHAKYKLA